MSAANDPGKQDDVAPRVSGSDDVAPTLSGGGFYRIMCKGCDTTSQWSDKPRVPCAVCAHVNKTFAAGKTNADKRQAFLALPIHAALQHDGRVPTSWLRQYIDQRTVSLFEHWKTTDNVKLLAGKSGLMQLKDMCNTATTAKELSAALSGQFIRGEHMAPCFDVLHAKAVSSLAWDSDSWTWVHALAPRVIDIWNVRPNAKTFAADKHAYGITVCYYQNLGEVSKAPPGSLKALFEHWTSTIERRDLMA